MSEQSANAEEAAVESKTTKAAPKKADVAECADDADATPKALVDTASSVQPATETAGDANEASVNAEPESTTNAVHECTAKALTDTEQPNSAVADEAKPTKRRSSKTAASKKTANSKSTETKATNKKSTASKTKTSSKSASKKQAKEADAESINTATAAAAAATSAAMDQAESLVTSDVKSSADAPVDTDATPNDVAETKAPTEATANATVVKRKRGRKPKASISTATESKAKTETVTVPENVTKDNPVSVPVLKPVSEVKANAEDKPKAKRGRKPKSDTQNKISADEMATDTEALDSAASDECKRAMPKSPFKKPYRRTKKVFANMSLEQMAQITPIDSVNKPSYDESIKPFIPAIVFTDSL